MSQEDNPPVKRRLPPYKWLTYDARLRINVTTIKTTEERIKIAATIIGGAISLTYFIGLMVSIYYSAIMNFRLFTLLQPFHILTGLWVLVQFLFIYVPVLCWRDAVSQRYNKLIVAPCVLTGEIVCLWLFFSSGDTLLSFAAFRFDAVFILVFSFFSLFMTIIEMAFPTTNRPSSILLFFFIVVAYLGLFATFLFPRIPRQLGGARAYYAQFVTASSVSVFPFSSSTFSYPIRVLFETEDAYLVDLSEYFVGPPDPTISTEVSYIVPKSQVIAVRITRQKWSPTD